MRTSRRTHRTARRPATLLAVLAATALGCSGAADVTVASDQDARVESDVESDVERDVDQDEVDALPDAFEPPARPEPSPDPQRPGACDAVTADAIAAVVSAQLDAFAGDDLDAAYALTSPFFQRLLDRDAFETMIRTGYPYLLESSGHRLDECWARSRRGYILAGVRIGTREVVLRYDLSDEPDVGWLIDGATEVPGISLPDDQLI